MFEALSFLSPRGPVTHDEQSRIYYESMHAAGICLGTIQARTYVQLALACQQSLCTMMHWAPLSMEFLICCDTIASPVTSTCCRAKQVFVSDCLQKRSLYAAGKWFPKFTDLRKSVMPSRTPVHSEYGLEVRTPSTVYFWCFTFFAFLVASLSAGLVAISSARSSWAARSNGVKYPFQLSFIRNSAGFVHGGTYDLCLIFWRGSRTLVFACLST